MLTTLSPLSLRDKGGFLVPVRLQPNTVKRYITVNEPSDFSRCINRQKIVIGSDCEMRIRCVAIKDCMDLDPLTWIDNEVLRKRFKQNLNWLMLFVLEWQLQRLIWHTFYYFSCLRISDM